MSQYVSRLPRRQEPELGDPVEVLAALAALAAMPAGEAR
jgi:hypothetical protein